jgi:hypothetical protein
VEEVRNVPGVADAGPIATSLVAIELSNGGELKVSLLGVDPGHPGEPEVKDGQQLNPSGLDEVILDQNVVLRSNLKLGDTITIRSSQGTDYKHYTLKVVGITSGQAYTFTPSIFVPISTWEKTRTKSEAEISHPSETTNVIAVKLNSNKQIEKMKEQLDQGRNHQHGYQECPWIFRPAEHDPNPGGIHPVDWRAGDWWFLPDTGITKSSTDWCIESHRHTQPGRRPGVSHPNRSRYLPRGSHRRVADFPLLADISPKCADCIQWSVISDRHHRPFNDRPYRRVCIYPLRRTHRTTQSAAVILGVRYV